MRAPAASAPEAIETAATTSSSRRIVALAFDSSLRAQEAMLAALGLQENKLLTVHDAVLVRRAADGSVEVSESTDPTPVAAAVPSGLVGALVGTLIAGPLGFLIGGVLAAGGGALAAKLIDTGIPDRIVHELRDLTRPGQTVLALLVSDISGVAVIEELRRFEGARVVYAQLPAEALAVLRQVLAGPRS
jgi:uncharacterized membrane protein